MKLKQKDFIKVIAKTNGRCFYCNKPAEEIDHFISKEKWKDWELDTTPLKGGLDKLENLFPICIKCNRRKSDKCPEDFIGNSFIAWSRYTKCNFRSGLLESREYNW